MIALRGNDDPPEEVSKKSTCATNAAVIDVRCSLGRSQLSVTTLSISFILKVPSAFTHPALYLFPPPFDSADWFPSCARPPFSIKARVFWLFALMFFLTFCFSLSLLVCFFVWNLPTRLTLTAHAQQQSGFGSMVLLRQSLWNSGVGSQDPWLRVYEHWHQNNLHFITLTLGT